ELAEGVVAPAAHGAGVAERAVVASAGGEGLDVAAEAVDGDRAGAAAFAILVAAPADHALTGGDRAAVIAAGDDARSRLADALDVDRGGGAVGAVVDDLAGVILAPAAHHAVGGQGAVVVLAGADRDDVVQQPEQEDRPVAAPQRSKAPAADALLAG